MLELQRLKKKSSSGLLVVETKSHFVFLAYFLAGTQNNACVSRFTRRARGGFDPLFPW